MNQIGRIRGNLDSLASSITNLKEVTLKNTKEMAKVVEEVKKVNEYNEQQRIKEAKDKTPPLGSYPVAKYQPNELTLSQLLVKKLDIV